MRGNLVMMKAVRICSEGYLMIQGRLVRKMRTMSSKAKCNMVL